MNNPDSRTVAVVGASNDPERYSNKAQQLLTSEGYSVIPVTPNAEEVLGVATISEIGQISTQIDTVSMYLKPQRQNKLIEALVRLKPRRVIFNPGAENPAAYPVLQQAGIDYEEACTLVLLKTGQF